MKLVFIYGPPATGKLTIAKELAKLTGFKLFDNHVSIQFVQSLFKFGTKPFSRLTDKFRIEMIGEAAKHGVDTIFTFVYGKRLDDPFIKRVLKIVNGYGGRVCFVRLECDMKELERRVAGKDRKSRGKVATKKLLGSVFRKHNLGSEVPFQPSFTIDTTSRSPRIAAKMIIEHYNLRVLNKR